MTERISFTATVRRQRTNLPGLYGLIRSKKLGEFIEKNVIITVELAPESAPETEIERVAIDYTR